MGVVLFQLPPNFRIDVPCLNSFLSETGSYSLRMAFEFRHGSWFCDEVYDVLRNRGVALCIAESDELETPDIMTAPVACYRFRRSGCSASQLDSIENILRRRSAEDEVFAYFKHEEEPTGLLCAAQILQRFQRS
jgi:uncharacterized protein YecE (DUF72 family)